MNLEGEVVLTRTLLDHDIWQTAEPFDRRAAFVHLLLLANNRVSMPVIRGRVREMKVGQVGHSMQGLAKQWGWSVGKVRRFLDWLQNRGTIRFNIEGDETEITLVNYDLWNAQRNTDGTLTEQRRNTDGTLTETEQEQEQEQEQETQPVAEAKVMEKIPGVPEPEEILEHVLAYGWTLDDAINWRLKKLADPRFGFDRMVNWQADLLLYARRLDGPPPRPESGAKKSAEKNGGQVSATHASIKTEDRRKDLEAEKRELLEAIQREDGWSEEKRANKQRVEAIERELAGLKGEPQRHGEH